METTNLKGEQGGTFLADGESFSTSEPKDHAVGLLCLTETVLTSLTMVGWGGTESKVVGATLPAGTLLPGIISEVTVATGLAQALKH